MRDTIVIQSHRLPPPHAWLNPCLDSVREWSAYHGYEHLFLDDSLFELLPTDLREWTAHNRVIAADLARLLKLRELLGQGYRQVIWCDADFLVFDPGHFHPLDESCALGCETWIQADRRGKLRDYRKVHNAFLMFRPGNSLLDFYIDTAQKLLRRAGPSVPSQFIGPKLLTALHNITLLPVQQDAAMLSLLVIYDLLKGGGAALELFIRKSPEQPKAANLCSSSVVNGHLDDGQVQQAIEILLDQGQSVFKP